MSCARNQSGYNGQVTKVREFLDERERCLREAIDTLRSEVIPLEQELLEVRLAKGALKRDAANSDQPRLALASPAVLRVHDAHTATSAGQPTLTTDPYRSPYFRLTIKQLVQKALEEHFQHGASANEMLHLFENVYGRGDIARTSLSPQLSRLREDGIIFRTGHLWRLRQKAPDEKAATDQ